MLTPSESYSYYWPDFTTSGTKSYNTHYAHNWSGKFTEVGKKKPELFQSVEMTLMLWVSRVVENTMKEQDNARWNPKLVDFICI